MLKKEGTVPVTSRSPLSWTIVFLIRSYRKWGGRSGWGEKTHERLSFFTFLQSRKIDTRHPNRPQKDLPLQGQRSVLTF
jgi:hypothetical protein